MSDLSPPRVSPKRIMQLVWGFAPPLILQSALELEFFEHLDRQALTAEGLAGACGCSLRGARALADALVGLEFLTRDDTGRYSLAPEASAFLVRGRPAYFGGFFRHTVQQALPNWLKLSETVRTGQPSAPVNLEGEGTAFFQQFVADLLTLNFKAAEALAAELLPVEPTGPFRVLDVAAGSGVWALGFARRSPRVEATLVDWPGVLEIARGCAARLGVEDRCRFLPGDLHAADFGPGYDVVLLGHILHCEGQTGSRRLLRKCFQALRPGGTLAIAEFVPNDDRRGPALPLLFAVNMLVSTQEGDTFTLQEIGTWLEDAGFGAVRTLEAPAPSPLILATRPAE